MWEKINPLAQFNNDHKPNRVEKKVDKESLENDVKKAGQTGKQVKIDISDSARELLQLRQEAKRYLDEILKQETLDEQQVAELKRKISQDNYFNNEEIVDKIVDKLLNLPGFEDLLE